MITDQEGHDVHYEPISSQVTLARDELCELVPQLRDLSTGTRLDERAAQIVRDAVAPHRGVVIEHLAADAAAAIRIGWTSDGGATISTGDAVVTITGTRLDRLPTLLAQLLRLEHRPGDRGRAELSITAGDLDDALSGRSPGTPVAGSVDGAWRATGGWIGRPADRSVTVLDGGDDGLWTCASDTDRSDDTDRAVSVHLRPVTPDEALALLGDVVTGRTETSSTG